MEIEDRELEHSPLSCDVTRHGITVEVLIYRFAGTADAWTLEVVDERGGSTVWEELFFTDQAAMRAFEKAVEEDGIRSFLLPREARH